jgi:hypothetical protein
MRTDHSTFSNAMIEVSNKLKSLGVEARNKTLVYNLLTWCHFIYNFNIPTTDETFQSFYFTATPNSVFNRNHMYGNIGNVHASCSVYPQVLYYKESSMLRISWSIDDYYSASCDTIVNPFNYGYDGVSNYAVAFDLISHTTAMAVNMGTISLDDLEIENYDPANVISYMDVTTGVTYDLTYNSYFDPQYPYMTPIYCINATSKIKYAFCFIAVPNSIYTLAEVEYAVNYGIPFMTHYYPSCLSCPGPGESLQDTCNNIDLLIGLVTYNDSYTIFDLAFQYRDNAEQLNDFTQAAATEVVNNLPLDSANFDFCGGSCTLFAISIYDYVDYSITPDRFNLDPKAGKGGACNDAFSSTNWVNLYQDNISPVPLTESYYKCKPYESDILFYAIGIASGNTSSFAPLIIILLLPILYLYLKITNQAYVDPHSQYEKEMAQLEFISKLLDIRDNGGIDDNQNSVLQKIVQELRARHRADDDNENISSIFICAPGAGDNSERVHRHTLSSWPNRDQDSATSNLKPGTTNSPFDHNVNDL